MENTNRNIIFMDCWVLKLTIEIKTELYGQLKLDTELLQKFSDYEKSYNTKFQNKKFRCIYFYRCYIAKAQGSRRSPQATRDLKKLVI